MPWDEALIDSVTKPQSFSEQERVLGYTDALNEALHLPLEQDSRVFILGQGVDDPHASFGVTRGLQQAFGESRVFDTPLSEEAMMGVCVGSALTGMRPIYFHNRPDFI